MVEKIIDGAAIAAAMKEELKQEVTRLKAAGKTVCLAVIQVGTNQASAVYIRNKKKACAYTGMESLVYEMAETITQEELTTKIEELNHNVKVDGILIQLPLPAHMDTQTILQAIVPEKDVDGFHPVNVGNLSLGLPGFVSCTPAGIIQLLKRSDIAIAGKECVIVGRSNIVGKPVALLMLRENATVTLAHTGSKDLASITRRADILITATGKAKFITKEYVKEGAVVIDVGMNRDEEEKLCGDVDFMEVKEKVSAITPVPGGVGPMTIAMLMYNCVEAAKNKTRR